MGLIQDRNGCKKLKQMKHMTLNTTVIKNADELEFDNEGQAWFPFVSNS